MYVPLREAGEPTDHWLLTEAYLVDDLLLSLCPKDSPSCSHVFRNVSFSGILFS